MKKGHGLGSLIPVVVALYGGEIIFISSFNRGCVSVLLT